MLPVKIDTNGNFMQNISDGKKHRGKTFRSASSLPCLPDLGSGKPASKIFLNCRREKKRRKIRRI